MPAMKRAAAVRANRIVVAKFALGARTRRPVHAPSSRNDPKVRDDRADTPAEDRNLLGFRAGFAAEASRRSVFAARARRRRCQSGSARSRPSPSRPAGPRPVGNRTGRQRPARPRRRARRDLEVVHLTQRSPSEHVPSWLEREWTPSGSAPHLFLHQRRPRPNGSCRPGGSGQTGGTFPRRTPQAAQIQAVAPLSPGLASLPLLRRTQPAA
jgi:hypothetical protein